MQVTFYHKKDVEASLSRPAMFNTRDVVEIHRNKFVLDIHLKDGAVLRFDYGAMQNADGGHTIDEIREGAKDLEAKMLKYQSDQSDSAQMMIPVPGFVVGEDS